MLEFTSHISDFPSVKTLLFRALFQTASVGTTLPDIRLNAKLKDMDEQLLKRYHGLTQWPETEYLHPALLHVLAMPLHLSLLLEKSFPFSVKGLLHVRNQISQQVWVKKQQPMDVSCYFAELEKHPKGWLFSVITEVYTDKEMVWKEKSTFLSRCRHTQQMNKVDSSSSLGQLQLLQSLSFDKDCGRKYAHCSGDYNPIHLWPWSAKLFGFPRHIAHGMFTMARCLSVLMEQETQTSGELRLDVNFKRPLFLPGQAQLFTAPQGSEFSLKNQDETFSEL